MSSEWTETSLGIKHIKPKTVVSFKGSYFNLGLFWWAFQYRWRGARPVCLQLPAHPRAELLRDRVPGRQRARRRSRRRRRSVRTRHRAVLAEVSSGHVARYVPVLLALSICPFHAFPNYLLGVSWPSRLSFVLTQKTLDYDQSFGKPLPTSR